MSRLRAIPVLLASMGAACSSAQSGSPFINTNIFEPISTPAHDVNSLSLFVLLITGGIFLGMSALLIYALVRYRSRPGETMEPPQVFGSTQVELAWTIIPVLLITVLFLGTARVIFAVQDAPKPANALDVIVVGHQFWWEFRYPKYGVVTANELHVPLDTKDQPQATFLKLTSADVMHSFWVPRLAGKTDLLPNRVNEMWFDPHIAGCVPGTVRAVLRSGAREDAAADLCGSAGQVCGVDQESAAGAGGVAGERAGGERGRTFE